MERRMVSEAYRARDSSRLELNQSISQPYVQLPSMPLQIKSCFYSALSLA